MENIVVLGSINMDLVIGAERAPESGETLYGSNFQTIPGGKGANQAVAIARQGVNINMIGRVGNDVLGDILIEKLAENNVGVSHIKKDDSVSTGIALIVVEKNGQNRIIVVAGANGQVNYKDIDEVEDLFENCDYLVLQLETPLPTVVYAINKAKSKKIYTVLNAAPAPILPFDMTILRKIDYLIVNESEAQVISGREVKDQKSAFEVAKTLQEETKGTIILTLGEQGAVTADGKEVWHTPAIKVDVVDTTAAGDAFVGGLVVALHEGNTHKEAVRYACTAGSLAVTKFGAQPSLPTKEETQSFIVINQKIKNN